MSRGIPGPHVCSCFSGYCWKNLGCRSKSSVERAAAELKQFNRPKEKRSNKPVIQTWRADGSHELGPIPEGRIPNIGGNNGGRKKD